MHDTLIGILSAVEELAEDVDSGEVWEDVKGLAEVGDAVDALFVESTQCWNGH